MAADEPRVTVAIVSWNTRELLHQCLESFRPSVDSGLAEVWVVDNASTDGSPQMVRERHPEVQLIARDDNPGYGRAINQVAERTGTPWLIVSNSDIRVTPGALERLIETAEADPGAGLVAPRLILPDGSTQHSVWGFPTVTTGLLQALGPRLAPAGLADRAAVAGAWDDTRRRRVPWAVGAFLLARRTAWDAVGGFDPALWMSAEDLDLGWRMRKAGWVTRYEPAAVVHHEESAATGAVWGEHLSIHWQRCAYAWMLRTMGRPRTVAFGAIAFTGTALRLVLFLARARFRLDPGLRAMARWTLVHAYALAPASVLARYR